MTTLSETRVVLVDDDTMIAEGFGALLKQAAGVEVVGIASDGSSAINVVERSLPDLVILDIHLPVRNGMDACAEIHKRHPNIGIIMFTAYDDEEDVIGSLQAGARGFVSKRADFSELIAAIDAVSRGAFYLSGKSHPELIENFLKGELRRSIVEPNQLTPTLRDLHHRLASGATNKDVARHRNTSVRTIEKERAELMHRLGATSFAELLWMAFEDGFKPRFR